MGVFYHLRHPLLALDPLYSNVADDLMLFQRLQREAPGSFPPSMTMSFRTGGFDLLQFPKLHFVEDSQLGRGGSNVAKLRLCIEAQPEREVYLRLKVSPTTRSTYAAIHRS